MRFESSRANLFEALQIAQNAVPTKTTLQVLYNFLFKLAGNTLEITATDLDLSIILRIEVKGEMDGSIVVNARKLLEVIRELPDLPVIYSVENDIVNIQSGETFQCHIAGFDAHEFPSMPEEEGMKEMEMSLQDLKFLYEKSAFAVSSDVSSRVALTGVLWEFADNNLVMVGTDGHRLGKAWVPAENISLNTIIILPPKAITQVLKLASGEEDNFTVAIGEANVRFQYGNATIFSKCIEGPYPEYDKVIPVDLSREITIGREELMSVLRRVSPMANSKTKQVKFAFEKDTLSLSARNMDMAGDSFDSLPVGYSGKQVKIGFNSTYVLEVLRLISSEEVRIKFNSALGATIFEPNEDGNNYFFIVMPLRLLEDE